MSARKTKKCSKCHKTKGITEFSKQARNKDGLRGTCRVCEAAAYKGRFKKGTSDDVKFSASGEKEILGIDAVADTKRQRQHDAEVASSTGLPAPRVMDLSESAPILQKIEDVALRRRCRAFLSILLEGGKHKRAMIETDFTWNNWANLHHKYPELKELWITCRDLGEEYRKIIRVDAAHERAVDGVKDPIYSPSGKYLGERTIYSDRLLELLIKADNPDRFSDKKKVEVVGTTIKLGGGFNREALKAEIIAETAEAEVIEEAVRD